MKGASAIVLRELDEKRFVLLTAVVLAVLQFLTPVFPHASWSAGVLVTTASAFVSIGFALGLAVVLGATMFGRDLSERRLSFYFARPVSAATIWFGRMGAALAMIVFSFAIEFLPPAFIFGNDWRASWNVELPIVLGSVMAASLFLLFGSHAVSTALRSRSPLVILDLFLLIVTVAALGVLGYAYFEAIGPSWDVLIRASAAVVALLVMILVVAGWHQLARGRAERTASHAAFSRAAWTGVAVLLLSLVAFEAWTFHATPAMLRSIDGGVIGGRYAVVEGKARHGIRAGFVVDLRDGSWRRLRTGVVPRPVFNTYASRNGNTILWTQWMPAREHFELVMEPIAGETPRVLSTAMPNGYATAVSDDGRRMASVTGSVVAVTDTMRDAVLASAALPVDSKMGNNYELCFVRPDLVRIYAIERSGWTDEHSVTAYELDVAAKKLTRTGATRVIGYTRLIVSADATRSLLRNWFGPKRPQVTAQLVDARTLEPLRQVASPGNGYEAVHMTPDGGIVIIARRNGQPGVDVRLIEPDGRELPPVTLASADDARLIGVIDRDRLLLATVTPPVSGDGGGWTNYVIDVRRGMVVREERDLRVTTVLLTGVDPRMQYAGDTQIAVDAKGTVLAWNALTGARKPLVAR